jgi:hypothetical protein
LPSHTRICSFTCMERRIALNPRTLGVRGRTCNTLILCVTIPSCAFKQALRSNLDLPLLCVLARQIAAHAAMRQECAQLPAVPTRSLASRLEQESNAGRECRTRRLAVGGERMVITRESEIASHLSPRSFTSQLHHI